MICARAGNSFIAGHDFGDFIIWRRDDVPAYQLAVVADDDAMQITEVVRGADLLKSTARQLLMIRALGLAIPAYYHCDLMRDDSRSSPGQASRRPQPARPARTGPYPAGCTEDVHFVAIQLRNAPEEAYRLPCDEEDVSVRLNWPAILLAGVADWLLGAVWFTAFANQWRMGLRMPAEEMQAYMSHPNFWPLSYRVAVQLPDGLCHCAAGCRFRNA